MDGSLRRPDPSLYRKKSSGRTCPSVPGERRVTVKETLLTSSATISTVDPSSGNRVRELHKRSLYYSYIIYYYYRKGERRDRLLRGPSSSLLRLPVFSCFSWDSFGLADSFFSLCINFASVLATFREREKERQGNLLFIIYFGQSSLNVSKYALIGLYFFATVLLTHLVYTIFSY